MIETDLRTRLGRTGVWGHLDSLAAPDLRTYASRVEELGYTALWVPETVGREPFVLAAILAEATDSIMIGTSIVNIWGRDAQATRMAAFTLQEASAGRFVLGLGVSHPHLAQKLRGHRFEKPLTRMREYLAAYRSAIYKGPIPPAEEPPVLVAALRERMIDLAATDADGAFAYLVTPARVRWMRKRLDAAGRRPILAVTLPAVLDEAGGRDAARAYLGPYLRTPTYQASWELQGFAAADWEQPGSDRLVDAMVAIGDGELIRARIGELVEAGADHVAIIPVGPDGGTEDLGVLEALTE
jgi:probable F420-dependent oxidoreductase